MSSNFSGEALSRNPLLKNYNDIEDYNLFQFCNNLGAYHNPLNSIFEPKDYDQEVEWDLNAQ